MKRIFLALAFVLVMASSVWAASYSGSYSSGSGVGASAGLDAAAIVALTADASPSANDLIATVDDVSGELRKVTLANLQSFILTASTIDASFKSVTIAKQSGVAGDMGLYEANSTDTHAAGFRGPASITGDGAYRILFPNARAGAAGQVLSVTNAAESGSGTAADPYIQTASWATGTVTIASGALALATSEIASGACQTVTEGSVNSAAATGVATTDVITFTPNATIKAVTGYVPLTAGGLTINAYPTAGYINVDVCNWSAAAITPGAVTINWRVVR